MPKKKINYNNINFLKQFLKKYKKKKNHNSKKGNVKLNL